MPAKPLKLVMIRRGKSKLSNVSSQNLVTFIRKKVLLGTDELSGDGKSWIRIDRHYQLRKYFGGDDKGHLTKTMQDNNINPAENVQADINPPPGLENNLEELANLLNDING